MRKPWYFILRKLYSPVSFLRGALAASLILASSLGFGSTPEWLKQAAHAPLPTYPADTDAVILLDERVVTVTSAGEIHTTHRRAYKILRPQGRDLGIVRVDFDSETQLKFLKGWSITAENEEYEVKESSAVETSALSESLYEDTRYKVLQIPAASPGNIIGYEYEQRQRPSVLQDIWIFQHEIPVRRARLIVDLGQNWSYATYWRNHASVSPQQAGDHRWTWDLEDIEPIKEEPQMPPERSLAGQLGISFSPQSGAVSKSSQNSWDQVGRWYADLARNRRAVTPGIRDKTRALVAGTDDPLEKIRRLASYVQHSIRYVAIEIGIGGFQPHSAQDVLANGYGDCKDKATLLNTMLREAGIDSYYVLINNARDYVSPDFPSPVGFNHAISAIRLPTGDTNQDLFAVLTHPRLGSLLFFDPTDSFTPLGYLPPELQSNYGLLVTEEGGELVKLPLLPPSANSLQRVATLAVDKSGNLEGTVNEIRNGPAAVELRELLLNTPDKQRQRVLQSLLADLLDGAVLTKASVTGLHEFTGSLGIEYGLIARGFAQPTSDLLLFRACALGRKSSNLLEGKPRNQAVVFQNTTSESDIFDISFPAQYALDELPQPVKYEYPFASYKSELHVADHVLHYTRTYELRDVRVPAERLGDLQIFFRQIANDERGYTILKAAPTASLWAPSFLVSQRWRISLPGRLIQTRMQGPEAARSDFTWD